MKFPFTGFILKQATTNELVPPPPTILMCSQCGCPCGHTGGGRMIDKQVVWWYVEKVLVIGENETEWFYEYTYLRDSDCGGYEVSNITYIEKSLVYLDEAIADAEAERLTAECST